ncbi:MAG: polysaccharide deacetylase family protein [Cytophagaceae bacterium]
MNKYVLSSTALILIILFNASAQINSLDYAITNWQGNKEAAVSVTFDDNCDTQFNIAMPYMDSKNIRGTFFVITQTGYSCSPVNWTTIRNAANAGHEIGAHTVHHPFLTQLDSNSIINELKNSRDMINSQVTTQTCITMAYPYGDGGLSKPKDAVVQNIAKRFYIAARSAGVNSSGCDDYNGPSEPSYYSYYYQVGSRTMDSITTLGQFTTMLNNTLNQESWFIPMYHSFNDLNDSLSVTTANFHNQMDAIYSQRQRFWIAPFGDVVRYRQEHETANLLLISDTPSKITLHLKDDMSDSIYTVPLTILLKIPSDYTITSIEQGSNNISFSRSNDTLKFNAVPDAGMIYLNKATVATGIHSNQQDFELAGNFPNPASENTRIHYSLYTDAHIKIDILNLNGDLIKAVEETEQAQGSYEVTVNTSDLRPGVYVYRLTANNFTDTARLTIIR